MKTEVLREKKLQRTQLVVRLLEAKEKNDELRDFRIGHLEREIDRINEDIRRLSR